VERAIFHNDLLRRIWSVAAVLHDLLLFVRGAAPPKQQLEKGDETMREKIAFQTKPPVTVALAYTDDLEVAGRYGDQIMSTLADEHVMFRRWCEASWLSSVFSPANRSPFARPNGRKETDASSNGR
jgi:hypothetical protein